MTCDLDVTLCFNIDPDKVKMNHRFRYPGRTPFRSKIIVRTHTYTERPIALFCPFLQTDFEVFTVFDPRERS